MQIPPKYLSHNDDSIKSCRSISYQLFPVRPAHAGYLGGVCRFDEVETCREYDGIELVIVAVHGSYALGRYLLHPLRNQFHIRLVVCLQKVVKVSRC